MIEAMKLSNLLFQLKFVIHDNILLSNQVAKIVEKHEAQKPFHLNVIEAACHGQFKETGHSLVLADMLRHPGIQASFLKHFLSIQHEFMEVTAERDRVDVALKGRDMFVIIENKVNGAGEQKSQVYRYVHEIGMTKYGFELEQIYVIYLNPTDRNLPSVYSLCDENGEKNVFEEIGKYHYKVQSYKYDILEWLKGLSIDNEHHISSALDQYIDFLENKFHTSNTYSDMNNEIKEFIIKELHIEGKPIDEQLSSLVNQSKKVNELLDEIDRLKGELSNTLMREWQDQIAQQLGIELKQDEHSFGIQLSNKVWLGIWDGHDSSEHLPYWGFQLSDYKKDCMPEIYNKIKPIIDKAGINNHKEGSGWVAWCTTLHGVERFLKLYESAKSSDLI